jgi:hypothetical protein
MKQFAALIFACLAMLSAAKAQPSYFQGSRAASQWMTNFYVDNDVAHIPDFITTLQSDGMLTSNPGSQAPVSAFLAAVFAANPALVRSWISSVAVTGDMKSAVENALWASNHSDLISDVLHDKPDYVSRTPPSMMTIPLTTPGAFDVMWASFLATGDVAYPRRLIDVLDPSYALGDNEAMNTVLRQTAAWSLASNMRQHDRIWRLIREEASKRTGTVHEALAKMLADFAAEDKPWPNQDGEFRAMLSLVSEDTLDAFEKSYGEGGVLNELSSASPGEHIVVKLTFARMDLSDDLAANVTYDFKILAPDGSVYGGVDHKGLTALNTKVATRFLIYDNNPTPIFAFDPRSALGVYTIVVTVYDNVGRHTLTLSKQITLTK